MAQRISVPGDVRNDNYSSCGVSDDHMTQLGHLNDIRLAARVAGPVVVTGANGFVGRVLVRYLSESGFSVRATQSASHHYGLDDPVGRRKHGSDLWREALRGAGALIHLAARTHVLADEARDPLAEYRRINVLQTMKIAREAAAAGIRRFVFVSSIKVNGERTVIDKPYSADDIPAPEDAYGQSKWEAEQALRAFGAQCGIEIVIVRPVLIYGPGVRGNFLRMMSWVHANLPLPFGAVRNARSLLAVENLVDLLTLCLIHPSAANEVFLASDGRDFATPELIRTIASAMERKPRLLAVPPGILSFGLQAAGMKAIGQRLLGSLQVSTAKSQALLGWKPPVSPTTAMAKTVGHFLAGV